MMIHFACEMQDIWGNIWSNQPDAETEVLYVNAKTRRDAKAGGKRAL
jgi:hypothetical protein